MLAQDSVTHVRKQLGQVLAGESTGNGKKELLTDFPSMGHRQDMSAQPQCRICNNTCYRAIIEQAYLKIRMISRALPSMHDGTEVKLHVSVDRISHSAGFAPRLRLHVGHSRRVSEL